MSKEQMKATIEALDSARYADMETLTDAELRRLHNIAIHWSEWTGEELKARNTARLSSNKYEGKAYLAPSGQWSWVITEDGEDLVRGAGYETEAEALEAMHDQLNEYTERQADNLNVEH